MLRLNILRIGIAMQKFLQVDVEDKQKINWAVLIETDHKWKNSQITARFL